MITIGGEHSIIAGNTITGGTEGCSGVVCDAVSSVLLSCGVLVNVASAPACTDVTNRTMKRLIRLGVDGIITNYPDKLKLLLLENSISPNK